MNFDVLVIGGGAAGLSCALLLGSAKNEPYVLGKSIGIIANQRSSSLQNAKFYNVLGLNAGTLGSDILTQGVEQLKNHYPHVKLIKGEKVVEIKQLNNSVEVITNKGNSYACKNVVLAIGPKNFSIRGMEDYMELHSKIDPAKQRTQLKNENHKVTEHIYVAGVLAGLRSQFAIATGSGATVAMDILAEWNNGKPVKIHDKITPQ
ncbi:FAD-dependent oxidoreductase [Urechidicola sp. KH5]